MSKENEKTLEVYERYATKFLQGCKERATERGVDITDEKEKWQRDFLKTNFGQLSKNAAILEIGSGDCQNAVYLRSQGFNVTPSDNATAFLEIQEQNNFTPLKFNLLTDKLSQTFDGILAWHVLLHFTIEDLQTALAKVYKMLTPGGIFICDIQNLDDRTDEFSISGGSSRWTDYPGVYHLGAERFFQYWREADFRAELENAGFTITNFTAHGGPSNRRWLIFVAEKPSE